MVISSDDNGYDIMMPVDAFLPETDIENLQTNFSDWKRCQPMTEASKKKAEEEKTIAQRNAHPRLTDVMLKILAYPIEQHSPMECMQFLAETKRLISEII